MRRRGLGTALVAAGAVAVALTLLAWAVGATNAVERSAVDARFSIRGTQPAPRSVAVVGIDAQTQAELGRFPFSRSYDARLIRRLLADGARVVALDLQFTEATNSQADGDLFSAASAAPGRVVLTTDTPNLDPGHRGQTNVFGGTRYRGELVGNNQTSPDSDGVLRRFQYETQGLRDFAVVSAQAAGHTVSPGEFSGGGAWINFAGSDGTVPRLSFADVLKGRDAAKVRGRVVVVGATDPRIQDIHATPTSPTMPGAEYQASKIATILAGFPLKSAQGPITFILIVLLGMVAPLVAWRFGAVAAAIAGVVAGLLFAVAAQLAFDSGRIVAVALPLLALLLGTIGAVAVTATFAALDRERTRTLFARFVPAAVVDQVLASTGEDVRLGGSLVEVTVVFCDLRGSTNLVESLGASRGIEVVNRYLTAMTEAILAHGGTLAGFRGDGLMAVFGAPLHQDDHARRAVAAARDMAGPKLAEVNEWVAGEALGDPLAIGVGVCTGVVVAGNVGSEQRMEYTVVGITANVAARLESMTKGTPHRIYISDSTRVLLGPDAAGFQEVGDLDVRGARAPVKVWAPA
jgi:adenylate cyclase